MIRVVVEPDPVRRRVRVFVLNEGMVDGVWVLAYSPHGDEWVKTEHGQEVQPTFDLSEAVFAAIVQEGMGVVPADNVMERAWKDAIGVRDRLLTIVERSQS